MKKIYAKKKTLVLRKLASKKVKKRVNFFNDETPPSDEDNDLT